MQQWYPPKQDHLLEENFRLAIKLFLKKALHKEKPWDCQYSYLAPGGGYNVRKALSEIAGCAACTLMLALLLAMCLWMTVLT